MLHKNIWIYWFFFRWIKHVQWNKLKNETNKLSGETTAVSLTIIMCNCYFLYEMYIEYLPHFFIMCIFKYEIIMFLAIHENWLNDVAEVRFICMNILVILYLLLLCVNVNSRNLFSFYSWRIPCEEKWKEKTELFFKPSTRDSQCCTLVTAGTTTWTRIPSPLVEKRDVTQLFKSALASDWTAYPGPYWEPCFWSQFLSPGFRTILMRISCSYMSDSRCLLKRYCCKN